jgi:cytochrome c
MKTLAIALCGGALLLAGAAQAQDAAHGQKVFKTYCAMCHGANAGGGGLGPSLHGVVGRKAGTLAGFSYSAAMKGSGVTWTTTNLDSYIAAPKTFVPNNKMSFMGVKAAGDRADLIGWLATQK